MDIGVDYNPGRNLDGRWALVPFNLHAPEVTLVPVASVNAGVFHLIGAADLLANQSRTSISSGQSIIWRVDAGRGYREAGAVDRCAFCVLFRVNFV